MKSIDFYAYLFQLDNDVYIYIYIHRCSKGCDLCAKRIMLLWSLVTMMTPLLSVICLRCVTVTIHVTHPSKYCDPPPHPTEREG